MRISDWSSDVCSSDLVDVRQGDTQHPRLLVVDQNLILRLVAQGIGPHPGQHRTLAGQLEELVAGLLQHFLANAGAVLQEQVERWEERRVGKEWVRTGRSRWSPYHKKTKIRRKTK